MKFVRIKSLYPNHIEVLIHFEKKNNILKHMLIRPLKWSYEWFYGFSTVNKRKVGQQARCSSQTLSLLSHFLLECEKPALFVMGTKLWLTLQACSYVFHNIRLTFTVRHVRAQ